MLSVNRENLQKWMEDYDINLAKQLFNEVYDKITGQSVWAEWETLEAIIYTRYVYIHFPSKHQELFTFINRSEYRMKVIEHVLKLDDWEFVTEFTESIDLVDRSLLLENGGRYAEVA